MSDDTLLNKGIARTELKKVIQKLKTLPTPPRVASRMLDIFTEEEPDIDDVVSLIETDQAITMKILKLVNSSYYGLRFSISSIRQAVLMIGFSEVRCVLLSITVSESLIKPLRKKGASEQDQLWKHSLACAICAEMIARKICPRFQGEAFVGGLLHDVGKLILDECFPDKTEQVRVEHSEHGFPWLQAEQNVLGVDHCTVGKWLAEKWNLPRIFTQAIWLHHHSLSTIESLDFVEQKEVILAICSANTLVHKIMVDSTPSCQEEVDHQDILDFLHIEPNDLHSLSASLGKQYSERASIFDLEENEVSFYYESLMRANQKLARIALKKSGNDEIIKINRELTFLNDLHIGLAPIDDIENILNKVAQTIASKFNKTEGIIYYMVRPESLIAGSYWSYEKMPLYFSIMRGEKLSDIHNKFPELTDGLKRLVNRLTRLFRIHSQKRKVDLPRYCDSFLMLPMINGERIVGEIGMIEEDNNPDPLSEERLKIFGYLASITETALSRARLIEDARETSESLSTILTKNSRMMMLLKKSHREFENLFEYSNDAVILHRTDGRVVRVNQRAVELFGYDKEEFADHLILEKIFPDLEGVPGKVFNKGQWEAAGSGNDTRISHKNGMSIDVEISSRLVDRETGLVQSIVRDISRQKQTARALLEEKELLGVTLRSIGEGVITTDTEGRVVLINMAAEKFTGWTQKDAKGRPLSDLFHIKNFETSGMKKEKTSFQQLTKTGKTADANRRTVIIDKEGRSRVISHNKASIIGRENTIKGEVLVFRDITERQKMEQEALKAQKFESIGILAGGIAHDFNNILTSISGNISLAKMYLTPEEKSFERLIQAEKATMRARDLTMQLLTFSQGGSPVKKTASIVDLINDSANFSLRGSNVRYEYFFQDDLYPVEVDEGQLNQVLNNLLINADHAMPEGGTIMLRAENISLGAGNNLPLKACKYVKLSIHDNGVGIGSEELLRIFDPYYTTKKQGNGLGLASAYSIIKKHDGYIDVESELGVGTTFNIYLPASENIAPAKKVEESRLIEGKGKVLVMDDEKEIRDLAGEMLGVIGYKADFAKDGKEAVEFYKMARENNNPFDAVIFDLTIPGSMGGKEAIQKVREIDPEVKAIVSSGYTDDPAMVHYKKYGFSNFMAKPYKINELSKVLHNTITKN